MLAAVAMVATRCISPSNARNSIDWELLLVIAGGLALGKAMQQSGLATLIGDALVFSVGNRPYLLLSSAFGLTAVLSALVGAKATCQNKKGLPDRQSGGGLATPRKRVGFFVPTGF